MAFFTRKRFGGGQRETAIPDGLWMKCPECHQTVYKNEVAENLACCPHCCHHHRMGARDRIAAILDPNSFVERHAAVQSADPLGFAAGEETYVDRISRAKKQSGLNEALLTGMATLDARPVAVGAMDSAFIMASMGAALGEKFCRIAEDAMAERVPLIVFAASGGARMQEGILALLQMAKTADAVRRMNEAGIPYIVVLSDPTSGGVFASFASLGDIILAEPRAYIGFAGARLIEGALKLKLPDGFQRAEYQFENGFVDEIVKRCELRAYLTRLVNSLHPQPRPVAESPVLPDESEATPEGTDATAAEAAVEPAAE